MNPRKEVVLGALTAMSLAAALTWPLAWHAGSALPGDLGDPLLNVFTLAWDADRIAHGFRGLWDAPFFFPLHDTLAFSEHLLGVAVFTAPVQWATGNEALAYNLAFTGSYALAAIGAYVLALWLWQSRLAACVAALAFAAAPHRALHISHLQLLMSGWLPLGLWGLHQYFASGGRRYLAVFTASFVLLSLSCGYFMFFGAVPVAVVVLYGVLQRRRAQGPRIDNRRVGIDLGASALVILLCLAPVALAYGRVRQATGLRRSLGEMLNGSAYLGDFISVPSTLPAWAPLLPHGRPEHALFPGVAVTLLALVAIAGAVWTAARRRWTVDAATARVGVYAVILALCTWLAFGPSLPGPYTWLLRVLPGFDTLRVPARFIAIVSLALAVLAGRGAGSIAARLPRPAAVLFAVFVGATLVAEGFAGSTPLVPFDPLQRDRQALNDWLRVSPPGGLLELPAAGPAFVPFTLVYQFNTLHHRHPVVNGYSGTGYALHDYLAGSASPLLRGFEVRDAFHGLRQIGVRYVVLHQSSFERWWNFSPAPLIEAADSSAGEVAGRVQFGDATAWALLGLHPEPRAATRGRPLTTTSFHASASHASDGVGLAFDGITDTKWSTGGAQQGNEWFQVDFDRETNLFSLEVSFGRGGYGERPRGLVIESEDAGGARRVLFEGTIVSQLIVGLAAGRPGATILLPENRTKTLRLRQVGVGGRMAWAIGELSIDARR